MLTFPTLAEQAVAEFRAATHTVSLATIAARMGADVEDEYPIRRYIFDDDTSREVTGRGRAHKVETFYP
jgi:isochorismate hydrolase